MTGVSADGRRIVGRATAPETPPSSPVSFIATLPVACSDDLDNDGDGLTDFGADPDCASRFDVNETE